MKNKASKSFYLEVIISLFMLVILSSVLFRLYTTTVKKTSSGNALNSAVIEVKSEAEKILSCKTLEDAQKISGKNEAGAYTKYLDKNFKPTKGQASYIMHINFESKNPDYANLYNIEIVLDKVSNTSSVEVFKVETQKYFEEKKVL